MNKDRSRDLSKLDEKSLMIHDKSKRGSNFPKLQRMKSMRSEYSGTTVIKQAINRESDEIMNELKNNASNT
jgi:hypothetical protein